MVANAAFLHSIQFGGGRGDDEGAVVTGDRESGDGGDADPGGGVGEGVKSGIVDGLDVRAGVGRAVGSVVKRLWWGWRRWRC